MKYKLNLSERFTLLKLLPAEGNFATLKIIRKLKESFSCTDSEIKDYNVQQKPTPDGGFRITWDLIKASEEKEFDLGEFAVDLIISKLKELNTSNKLEEIHFTIYEKFIEN